MPESKNEETVGKENEMKIWMVCDPDTGEVAEYRGVKPPEDCVAAIPFPVDTKKAPEWWLNEGVEVFSKDHAGWRIYLAMIPNPKKDHKFVISDKSGCSAEVNHCKFHHAVFYSDINVYAKAVKDFEKAFGLFVGCYDEYMELRKFAVAYEFITSDEKDALEKAAGEIFEFRFNTVSRYQTHKKRLRLTLHLLGEYQAKLVFLEELFQQYSFVSYKVKKTYSQIQADCYNFVKEAKTISSYDVESFSDCLEGINLCAKASLQAIMATQEWKERDLKALNRFLLERTVAFYQRQIKKHMADILMNEVDTANKEFDFRKL